MLVGIVGPSGSGKTFSALRLATGIQRVCGGDIFVIDTEARRALHYADRFKFRHVAFGAPFSPLDYLAAINHCVERGAKTIVVDSTSHEHESVGGVLEMHAAEHKRLGGSEKVKLLAWNKPKTERRRLINSVLQLPVNFIFCFRAKEKIKPESKEIVKLGFMPISGDEWVYEMTLKCLLLPGSNGVPLWKSEFVGERGIIKLPEQFRSIFESNPQLTEDVGESLAKWAAGGAPPKMMTASEIVDALDHADAATLGRVKNAIRLSYAQLSKADQKRVEAAGVAAAERIEKANRFMETETAGETDNQENAA